MDKIKIDISRYKKKKKVNSETAEIVFSFIEKYHIDIKEIWGKRLLGAMLRETKKNKDAMRRRIANADEALDIMKSDKSGKWRKIYDKILSSQDKKIRFFWNKLLK